MIGLLSILNAGNLAMINAATSISAQIIAQSQVYNAHAMRPLQNIAALGYPVIKVEPGIDWKRTGGKTHRVTIRR